MVYRTVENEFYLHTSLSFTVVILEQSYYKLLWLISDRSQTVRFDCHSFNILKVSTVLYEYEINTFISTTILTEFPNCSIVRTFESNLPQPVWFLKVSMVGYLNVVGFYTFLFDAMCDSCWDLLAGDVTSRLNREVLR